MPVEKIAITLDRALLEEIDRGVKAGLYRNRRRAIEEAVREKLDRYRRRRLAIEAKKLDRAEERALAEEGMAGEARSAERTPSADEVDRIVEGLIELVG